MSVLIKGMEMPKSCDDCYIANCPNDIGYTDRGKCSRHINCPIIELPELHGRLGDYDGLKVKYIVFKASNGMPVDDCFVLRPEKDNAAVAALAAYADTTENQVLAADILEWLSSIVTASEE